MEKTCVASRWMLRESFHVFTVCRSPYREVNQLPAVELLLDDFEMGRSPTLHSCQTSVAAILDATYVTPQCVAINGFDKIFGTHRRSSIHVFRLFSIMVKLG